MSIELDHEPNHIRPQDSGQRLLAVWIPVGLAGTVVVAFFVYALASMPTSFGPG